MMTLTANIRYILIGMAVMVVLVEIQLKMTNERIIILDASLFEDALVDENTKQVREKRTAFSTALRCEEAPTRNATLRSEWYTPPNLATSGASAVVAAPVQPCTCSFLDLGVGRGESLGWFIDAGIPTCPTGEESHGSKIAHYDIETGVVTMQLSTAHTATMIQPNTVTAWAYKVMQEAGKQTMARALEPEEYCYYGVEENSIYTSVLQQLGTVVLQSLPRPLRQVHFYTETPIVTAAVQEGGKHNKSKLRKSGGGIPQGITLSRLLKETADPKFGNHVMIRVHADNAYAVLNEAYDSGALCAYAEKAVRLDILVQSSREATARDSDDYERFRDIVKGELHMCSVHVTE